MYIQMAEATAEAECCLPSFVRKLGHVTGDGD